jgi:molybdopterin-guanine dinucleotide biosynthesis protein B
MRVIGLAGWSGSGKTTLLKRVIPRIVGRGLTVSTVKHAHHGFDVDHPGKDSYAHRVAGATEVLVASSVRFALMHELRNEAEPGLRELLTKLSRVDMVLVEGYKRDRHPKLEIHRTVLGKPFIHPDDADIIAIAADRPVQAAVPVVLLDDVETIVDILLKHAIPVEDVIAAGRSA